MIVSPLDGKIPRGQELRAKAGQWDRTSDYTKDAVLFCVDNKLIRVKMSPILSEDGYVCVKWWGKEESYPDKCRDGGNRAAALRATAPPPADATFAHVKHKVFWRKFPFLSWKTEKTP